VGLRDALKAPLLGSPAATHLCKIRAKPRDCSTGAVFALGDRCLPHNVWAANDCCLWQWSICDGTLVDGDMGRHPADTGHYQRWMLAQESDSPADSAKGGMGMMKGMPQAMKITDIIGQAQRQAGVRNRPTPPPGSGWVKPPPDLSGNGCPSGWAWPSRRRIGATRTVTTVKKCRNVVQSRDRHAACSTRKPAQETERSRYES
jgi:hypothetical protein